jgi:hypothetical protein
MASELVSCMSSRRECVAMCLLILHTLMIYLCMRVPDREKIRDMWPALLTNAWLLPSSSCIEKEREKGEKTAVASRQFLQSHGNCTLCFPPVVQQSLCSYRMFVCHAPFPVHPSCRPIRSSRRVGHVVSKSCFMFSLAANHQPGIFMVCNMHVDGKSAHHA